MFALATSFLAAVNVAPLPSAPNAPIQSLEMVEQAISAALAIDSLDQSAPANAIETLVRLRMYYAKISEAVEDNYQIGKHIYITVAYQKCECAIYHNKWVDKVGEYRSSTQYAESRVTEDIVNREIEKALSHFKSL